MTAAIELSTKPAVKIVVNAVSGGSSGGGSGTVTNVTGTAPIAVATGTTTPVVSIAAATTLVPGSMSAADKTKLDGVATGATANATDAQLRDRSTHTGTQTLATISDAGTLAGKSTITSSDITDGTIVDGDISASAAIATSKISGLGGAATLNVGTTAGTVAAGDDSRFTPKATVIGGQSAGSQVNEPATATSLLTSTVTVPACAAGDVLMFSAGLNFTQNSTQSRNVTFAVKLGATTIISIAPTVTSSANARTAHLQGTIRVHTTTTQSGSFLLAFIVNAAGNTGVAAAANGTATENLASASTLDLLVTATNNTTQNYTLQYLTVTKVAA